MQALKLAKWIKSSKIIGKEKEFYQVATEWIDSKKWLLIEQRIEVIFVSGK